MKDVFVIREKSNAENVFNAGTKARQDIDSILLDMGVCPLNCGFDFIDSRGSSDKFRKIMYHFKTVTLWKKQIQTVPQNSIAIIQFPIRAHTIFFSSVISEFKKRNIKTIAIIHDLETLRNAIFYKKNIQGYRLRLEEINVLKKFDMIVVHNDMMQNEIVQKFKVNPDKLISLEIFDYLIPGKKNKGEKEDKISDNVIIAGNLDCDKCGYIYKLPAEPSFELYGSNYKGNYADNVHYNGAYLPDELPFHMYGGYGLIWDGDEIDTCTGIFGEYLKYNNPHKASLYLASGIPVVVWKNAAISGYIQKNKCGIVVDTIEHIAAKIRSISIEDYKIMKQNAEEIGKKLRDGYHTRTTIRDCVAVLRGMI